MRPSPPKIKEHARILLVDDNRNGLTVRKAVLEEIGYAITTATNGKEALALFELGRFDLVVTDFRMPGMDGRELIRSIKGLEPSARVILVSGFVEPLGLTEQNTGADVVISKSAGEVNLLIRSVGRLLRKPPASQGLNSGAKARGTGS